MNERIYNDEQLYKNIKWPNFVSMGKVAKWKWSNRCMKNMRTLRIFLLLALKSLSSLNWTLSFSTFSWWILRTNLIFTWLYLQQGWIKRDEIVVKLLDLNEIFYHHRCFKAFERDIKEFFCESLPLLLVWKMS